MSLTLVVLAAGIGSRYGGLKQIDPVGPSGEIVLDYSVYDALQAGFTRVVFVIRRDIEKDFRAIVGHHLEKQIDVAYVRQELDDMPAGFQLPPDRKKPWGTGHAILVCRDAVQGPFAVINADDFYGRTSFRVLADYLKGLSVRDTNYSMVGFILRNTLSENGHVARGVCEVDASGLLKGVVERVRIERAGAGARYAAADGQLHDLTANEIVSMNMWGFTPSIFGYLAEEFPRFLTEEGHDPKAEFFIPAVVDKLIKEGKASASVLETPEKWLGITYPADKPLVVSGIRSLISAGTYPQRLWPEG